MTCTNCKASPVKFARAVQTKGGPLTYCGNKPKCVKAAIEREKYEATKRRAA